LPTEQKAGGSLLRTLTEQSEWRDEQRPHLLVTTPESLFILLTAEKPRDMLRTTRTVIVDEIHAVADDKRGSHLALTLARLDALVMAAGGARPQRIGPAKAFKPLPLVFSSAHTWTRRAEIATIAGRCV
jgi:Lhr-like helicase